MKLVYTSSLKWLDPKTDSFHTKMVNAGRIPVVTHVHSLADLRLGAAGRIAFMTSNESATAATKPQPEPRAGYKAFRTITTRWMDNDAYGHVNNVIYYSWFDTAVNAHLIEHGALNVRQGETIGLVIETRCNYFAPVEFPQTVEAGLRVAHVGKSSVRYEVGLFVEGEEMTAAKGHFVHVYVSRGERRPVPLPAALVRVLKELQ